ncbi:MAG: hypothetical protein LUO84_01615 [Methanomassiliicoccales archaeon]|nr:hypothetical protein [Methanomassiliicoccales archaeon]
MKIEIPESLKVQHRELHKELASAMKAGGEVGSAARKVAEILHPHFEKEEEYALPPLGLLRTLATRKYEPEMEEVLVMTAKLKSEYKKMLDEHKAIVLALDGLAKAAKKEKKERYVELSRKLKMHALDEEEFLYPASLLIGRYVRERVELAHYDHHAGGGCC